VKICLSCEGVTNAQASRCGHCNGWLLPTDSVHYPIRRGEIDAGNPLLGTVVDGKYRLQSVLGRGGLGTVFRAQHIGSLVTVALKLLHPRFAERPEYRRALLPEARRAATVTHERCARLLDAGEAEAGVAYLVMELVEGKTFDLVLRQGPLHASHAVVVLEQVAEALAAIHAVGLVHCDLSPRNVMVASRAGTLQVKVLDFGIARSVSLAGGQQGKAAFAGFLSPAFAAPELLRGEDVDPRADLWSFGVLAWLLLTGTMPHDDADPARAAAAILAGERRPWPAGTGVPRRLLRLVQKCLQFDRAHRPASAGTVARQLAELREARRPLLAQAAVSAFVVAVLALLSGPTTVVVPLLQPVSGSPLALVQGTLRAEHEVQHRQSRQLETLVFHCAGFPPDALRADLVRGGRPLLRTPLRPESDPVAGTLTVSTAQPAWREVLQGLLRASEQDAIDLVFVVPGQAPLGTARLRLDDVPPTVDAELLPDAAGLHGNTVLRCTFADGIGVQLATATIVPEAGKPFEIVLPTTGGDVDLGQRIATKLGTCGALGPGRMRVHALDRAGNRGEVVLPFAHADVAAPLVRSVTGPSLEPFLPIVGGRVRMRVELVAGEPDCTLAVGLDGTFGAEVPLPGASAVHTLELDLGPRASSGPWLFRVTDAAGNVGQSEISVQVRDRGTRVEVVGSPAGAVFVGDELVLAPGGLALPIRAGSNWIAVDVRVVPPAGAVGGQRGVSVPWQQAGDGVIHLELPVLPPGRHDLRFDLQEGDAERGLHTTTVLALRVLPEAVELSVPAARPRFLPQLVAAGVLQENGSGYVEGPGFRIDPELRPFVRGTLRVGTGPPLALAAGRGPAPGAALLPVVLPTPGRNVLVLDLADPLGRPLRVRRGDDGDVRPATGFVLAEFLTATGAPELVGEELLVEHGQPARVRLRCPLPFAAEDLPHLRLRLAESEVPAAEVIAQAGDTAMVVFDVPAPVWTVAAKLTGTARDEYGQQLERAADVTVATPAGAFPMRLRVRTTRSTLLPVELGDEAPQLPAGLRGLRFLPVLAPIQPFAEPIPPTAPPRASFRPQIAVAVRNLQDFLLQDREFTWGQARALLDCLPGVAAEPRAMLVHHDDPRRDSRLQASNLLPVVADGVATADDDALRGVDFFQAWSLARLLGVVAFGDPEACRLPFGCELELAAFGTEPPRAAHGAGAHGGQVDLDAFLHLTSPPSAMQARRLGDVVPTVFGEDFLGLDFGLCEWVLDVPHIPGTDLLQKQWLGDLDAHQQVVGDLASGKAEPKPDPVGPLRTIGVVRGLPIGDRVGLLAVDGRPLDVAGRGTLPPYVPGVLRTEQLRRDGHDPLSGGLDPRLASCGFRVLGVVRRWTTRPGGGR
jgi:hypothetical protein